MKDTIEIPSYVVTKIIKEQMGVKIDTSLTRNEVTYIFDSLKKLSPESEVMMYRVGDFSDDIAFKFVDYSGMRPVRFYMMALYEVYTNPEWKYYGDRTYRELDFGDMAV